MVRKFLLMHVVLAATVPVCASENWPQFRGPGARGVAGSRDVPHCWSAVDNVRWKTEIPGRGWSSPIVWGSHVFLTTVVGEDDSNPPRGKVEGGEAFSEHRQLSAADRQWKILCLDLVSGEVNWERLVHRGPPPAPTHVKNSYATETPVTDGDRVYACFGNVGLFCFDFSGRLVWSKATPPRAMQYDAGTATSPVLDGDRVYLLNDNEEQSYLLALDKRTGQEVWRVDRDEKSNWCTPHIWKHERRTEIVTSGSGRVRAYNLDGQLLWWLTGMSGITVPTPFAGQGLLYVSSGYIRDNKRPVYAIRPGAAGDISLRPGETGSAAIAWCRPKAAPYHPTPLLYEGRLYVLYDRGWLSAFDAQTGEPLFEKERFPRGGQFWASPWAAGGRVFCLNEDGVTFVLRAGNRFELLSTNKLADDDMCFATPAMAGDRLLIRTSARIYCIEGVHGREGSEEVNRDDQS